MNPAEQHPLYGKRIFITEDNLANRVIYTMKFIPLGAIVDYDRWGSDTVWRLKHFAPDLIILDLMLTRGTNGFQIFEAIRQLPEFDAVPIVAISASDAATALPKCQTMGFAGFIAKPLDEDQFIKQMIRLLAGEQVWYTGEGYGGDL